MSVVEHHTLVRDGVPQRIRSQGDTLVTRTLTPAEFRDALLAKLVEEAEELRDAPSDQRIAALADVWEVFSTAVAELGFTLDQVEQAALFTRVVRGGFAERTWLETTTDHRGEAVTLA